MEEQVMTPEEKMTLKEEVLAAVEEQLSSDVEMTRADAIGMVAGAIEALTAEPEMGGMGEEAEEGMQIPGEEEE